MLRSTGERMRVSMTLPSMAGGLDRETFLGWCQGVDEGPFHALAIGERIAYDNLESLTTLGAAAAATERVCISPTIVVLPAHPPVVAAKQLATIDVISGGRLVVGVGVGGREEDYRAFGASFGGLHQRLDDHMAQMRSVWAGDVPEGLSRSVGPQPVGPMPVLSGSLGPKSMQRATAWADGVNGFSLSPNSDDWTETFARVREAWEEAAAAGAQTHVTSPYLATSFFSSGSPDRGTGGPALREYARRYLEVFGAETAEAMADLTSADCLEATVEALDRIEAAGGDEVYLVPITTDLAELDRLSTSVADR